MDFFCALRRRRAGNPRIGQRHTGPILASSPRFSGGFAVGAATAPRRAKRKQKMNFPHS
jgi:hypothetical protein